MTSIEATVNVIETDSDWTFSKTFVSSPIRVGRDRRNGVRLHHPAVATFAGEIAFGPAFVAFRNLSCVLNVAVDGAELPPMSTVALKETSRIALGPFQIEVQIRARRAQDEPASATPARPARGYARVEPAD